MNLRRNLISPRRCCAAAVATAAALLLTPGTAFATGHPVSPDRPASVEHTAESGDAAGHSTDRPAHENGHTVGDSAGHAAGHAAGHKKGRRASGHKNRHKAAGHKTGHAAAGHAGGHSGSHSTGHSVSHPVSHRTGHTAGHPTGSAKTGARLANTAAPNGGKPSDTGAGPDSSSAGGAGAGPDKGDGSGTGKNSGGKKPPQSGPMATVTKLSMSKTLTATRPVAMSARVSPAHRTVGAPPETGTVVFTVDGSSSGPLPVASNRVAVKIKLAAGKHTAGAKYSGDSAHSPSESGPVSFTVN